LDEPARQHAPQAESDKPILDREDVDTGFWSETPAVPPRPETIEKALEMKIVQEKLRAYGLDAQEVKAKLSSMSPTQIHTLARACDDVLAGGDSGLGVVIALLVIVILVIIILKLLNKEIIIRMSDRDGPAVHTGHPVC
ncbi:MAG TPA: PA2779 family protein, partial [Deltaproteobacteria bacterium]|nr:PA2779 family protein [Deltaproteobacteria bacterium]